MHPEALSRLPLPPTAPCSWCGSNNSSMFAELVPEEQRSTIYAFDRSFEVRSAAAAASLWPHRLGLACTSSARGEPA